MFVRGSKKAVKEKVMDQRKELNKLLSNAPFRRQLDKYFFVYGLCLLLIESWLVGAYPGTYFMTFNTVMCPIHIFYRIFVLYEYKSLYYLTDFCYYSTLVLFYFINFDPKNETLLRMCYVHSNGALAMAIWAFNT